MAIATALTAPTLVPLDGRGLLAVSGPDRRSFLQGLISNDIGRAAADRAIHAALLTPQGRYLHDFLIVEIGETLILDSELDRLEALRQRLTAYRLRAKVQIETRPDWRVFALIGGGAAAALGLGEAAGTATGFADGVAFVDPRLPALGLRLILPPTAIETLGVRGWPSSASHVYDTLRLRLGVPDGARDLADGLLLENGFDELNGIDWKKGCYVGQEVTARMRYRALVRKRLTPVRIEGAVPSPGTILLQDGVEAGEMRSAAQDRGLALLRLDRLPAAGTPILAGDTKLYPETPAWMRPDS
jgi:folate-binding protein YgfZ